MRRFLFLFTAVACAAIASQAATAQNEVEPRSPNDEVEVDRVGVELLDRLPPRPDDVDRVDTALVFTNSGWGSKRVRCVAFDDDGRAVGRVRLSVPSQGLRYVLASDLSDGRDFVGSAQCSSSGHITGSAIWLGPGITDLTVRQGALDGWTRIRFAVVATY